jgi:magnesium and cobalt transporter
MEEIVGEIEDEYDQPRPEDIQTVEENTFMVSGRAPLEEIEERLGLKLESEQVETLSGFICELAGRVPTNGESFAVNGEVFEIKDADAKQIHWILIKPRSEAPTDSE